MTYRVLFSCAVRGRKIPFLWPDLPWLYLIFFCKLYCLPPLRRHLSHAIRIVWKRQDWTGNSLPIHVRIALHLNILSSVSGFEFDCCSHSFLPDSLYSLSSPAEIIQYGLPSSEMLSNLNGFPIRSAASFAVIRRGKLSIMIISPFFILDILCFNVSKWLYIKLLDVLF